MGYHLHCPPNMLLFHFPQEWDLRCSLPTVFEITLASAEFSYKQINFISHHIYLLTSHLCIGRRQELCTWPCPGLFSPPLSNYDPSCLSLTAGTFSMFSLFYLFSFSLVGSIVRLGRLHLSSVSLVDCQSILWVLTSFLCCFVHSNNSLFLICVWIAELNELP